VGVRVELTVFLNNKDEVIASGTVTDRIIKYSFDPEQPIETSCSLSLGYNCLDHIVHENNIILQLENNRGSNLSMSNFTVSDCLNATTNPKVQNYQMFRFEECNNGGIDSVFDMNISFTIEEDDVVGHIRSNVIR